MAIWNRKKVSPNMVNSGKQYVNRVDSPSADDFNAAENNAFYAVDFAEAMADTPDTTNVGNVGTPAISLIDNVKNGITYKKFKFENFKGGQGLQGKSYRPQGTWSPTGSYVNDTSYIDVVLWNGSSYYCILSGNGSNNPSVDATHWALLVSKGAQGNAGTDAPQALNTQSTSTENPYSAGYTENNFRKSSEQISENALANGAVTLPKIASSAVDTDPTSSSPKLVSSGGTYDAIQAIANGILKKVNATGTTLTNLNNATEVGEYDILYNLSSESIANMPPYYGFPSTMAGLLIKLVVSFGSGFGAQEGYYQEATLCDYSQSVSNAYMQKWRRRGKFDGTWTDWTEMPLKIDTTPTSGSTNVVTSGGIFTAIANVFNTVGKSTATNLNSIADGLTMYGASTLNQPITGGYGMCLQFRNDFAAGASTSWLFQIAITTGNNFFVRSNINNVGWSVWIEK